MKHATSQLQFFFLLIFFSMGTYSAAYAQLLPSAPKKPVVEEKKPAPRPVTPAKKPVQPAVKRDTVAQQPVKPPVEEKKPEQPPAPVKIPASAIIPMKEESINTKLNFREDFNDNQFGWFMKSDKDYDIGVFNGKYRMFSKLDKSSWFATRLMDMDVEKDFSISVVAKWQEGIENNRFGIQFCSDRSGDNYMFFGVSANGYYIIADYKDGKWYPMKDWTQSDKVNKKYVPNLLSIRKEGRFISYYLNDQQIFSMPFEGGYGRSVGFRLADKQTVEFDQLEISATRMLIPDKVGMVKPEPYFIDPFNINTGWTMFDDNNKRMSIFNGGLQIFGLNSEYNYWTTRSFPFNIAGDFSVSTQVKWLSGTDNNAFGITFGCDASMANNFYYAISANGYYVLWQYTNKEFKKLIPWTTTDLVKKGSAVNKIELRKIGRMLELYINEKMVDKIPAPTLYGDHFGLRLSSNQTVEYDDFVIRQLN